jgi:hypothetical protein
MLKASWGGGGKGIRKVHNNDEVRQVFKQIQGEVRRGEGGGAGPGEWACSGVRCARHCLPPAPANLTQSLPCCLFLWR